MKHVWYVARDLLHEAIYRRWIVGLVGVITLVGLVLVYALQLEVIDGVLAGTRLFGEAMDHEMRTANSLLRPFFVGGGVAIYVLGLAFGILACSNFAPELLAPGRIEHLLSLPLSRWQLIAGTYLGVMAIALLGSLYAGGVFTLLIGVKSGVWSLSFLACGLSACIAFSAIYGVMLLSSVVVRSPGLSAALGGLLLALGAGLPRPELVAMLDPGMDRALYVTAVAWLPRFAVLGRLGLVIARLESYTPDLLPAVIGAVVFGLACVAFSVWEIERKDY